MSGAPAPNAPSLITLLPELTAFAHRSLHRIRSCSWAKAAVTFATLGALGALLDDRPLTAIGTIGVGISVAGLARRRRLWADWFTPLGFFTAFYLVLTVGGMSWLYVRGESSFTSLLMVLVTFLAVTAGAFLVGPTSAVDRPNVFTLRSSYRVGFLVLLIFAALVTIYALLVRANVPIITLLSRPGDFVEINRIRYEYTTGTPGFSLLSQLFGNVLPYVSLFAFVVARASGSRAWWWGSVGLISFNALALILSTQRAPILWFLLLFLLAVSLISGRTRPIWLIAYGLIAALVFLGFLGLRAIEPGTPIQEALATTFWGGLDRLFLVQNRVADFVVRLPTGFGSYLGLDLIALRPGPDLGFSAIVFNKMFPGASFQGTAPSIFAAQLFADFGWAGVIVGAAAVGYFLGWLERVLSQAKDLNLITLVVALTLAITRLQELDLVSAIIDFGILAYLGCFGGIWVSARVAEAARPRSPWLKHWLGRSTEQIFSRPRVADQRILFLGLLTRIWSRFGRSVPWSRILAFVVVLYLIAPDLHFEWRAVAVGNLDLRTCPIGFERAPRQDLCISQDTTKSSRPSDQHSLLIVIPEHHHVSLYTKRPSIRIFDLDVSSAEFLLPGLAQDSSCPVMNGWPTFTPDAEQRALAAQSAAQRKGKAGYRPYLQDYSATGDYLNYGTTLSYFYTAATMRFDLELVPLVRYEEGYEYNPITVAQYALTTYGQSLQGGNTLRPFLQAAERLITMQDDLGALRFPFRYKYSVTGEEYEPGWISGMAQGLALSVFERAYHITRDPRYAHAGESAFQFLITPVSEGGPMNTMQDLAKSLDRYIFFDEVVARPSAYILDGFMYTLLGLYDWSRMPLARGVEKTYLDRGIDTLVHILPYYDIGGFSTYDLAHITYRKQAHPALGGYHESNVALLHALWSVTGQPHLRDCQRLWRAYIDAP